MTKSKLFRNIASLALCAAMLFSLAVPAFAEDDLGEFSCTDTITLPGDANGDGTVNVIDAIAIVRSVTGYDEGLNQDNADTHNDGAVNVIDAIKIVKFVTGYDGIRLGHKDVEEVSIMPTCSAGELVIYCENCGAVEFFDIAPVIDEHTFSGGACIICWQVDEILIGDGISKSEKYTELRDYIIANDYFEGSLAPMNSTVYLLEDYNDDFTGRSFCVDFYDNDWGEHFAFTYTENSGDCNKGYSIYIDMDTDLVRIDSYRNISYEDSTGYEFISGFSADRSFNVTADAGIHEIYDLYEVDRELMSEDEISAAEEEAQALIDSTIEEFDALLAEVTGFTFADLGLVK